MKTQFYFSAPVEVVKVTNENLAEVAEWCDGKVAATESRRVAGRMDSYVWVPTPKGNSLSWAFPGMYITKRLAVSVKDEIKATYQVFRRDYFSRNFFDSPLEAVENTWEKGKKKPKPEDSAEISVTDVPLDLQYDNEVRHAQSILDATFGDKTTEQDKKEKDMERNQHGVPVITEEEAAQRAAAAGEALHYVGGPTAYPDGKCGPQCGGGHPVLVEEDSTVINPEDKTDVEDPQVSPEELNGDALADGQILEGGEIAITEDADGSPTPYPYT